ncbi:MAG: membrane protein of unknown function [Promethearchaeota archaeon]|nr:MAG: membrane protein of unknown function [Candidatus Lokiarchaeota archaeon]
MLIEVTNYDFSDESFLIRSAVFLGITFSLILIFEITQKKSLQFRGLSLAIIAGLWAMIQNFLMAFFTAAISKVTSGSVELIWIFMMIIGGVLAFLSLAISIARMQVGFRYNDAHLAIPVREIPTQFDPAFLYVIVFALTPPVLIPYHFYIFQ